MSIAKGNGNCYVL